MGVAESFEAVKRQAASEAKTGANDASPLLRKLDARQRKALELFRSSELISSQDIAKLFGLQARAARVICQKWVEKRGERNEDTHNLKRCKDDSPPRDAGNPTGSSTFISWVWVSF